MATVKQLNYQIFPLFLSEFGKKKGLSKIIIASPSEEEVLELGSFFALLEVNAKTEVNNRIVTLFEDIEGNYYEAFGEDEEINIENHLEMILQKANHKLQRITESANLTSKPDFLNFTLGVIKGNNLYFVKKGYFSPFLIHLSGEEEAEGSPPKKRTRDKDRPSKMVNILEGIKDAPRKEAGAKIFSHIISGKINSGDYLFFCNENILDNISLSKIKKTITTLPPKSALEHIKNLLLEINNPAVSFLGLLVKFALQHEPENKFKNAPDKTPSESMGKLISLKEKTDKLLSPAIIPEFKKLTNRVRSSFKKLTEIRKPKAASTAPAKPEAEKIIFSGPKLKWPHFLVKLSKLLTNKNGRLEETHQKIREEGANRLGRAKHWLKALSPSSRTILIITLVFSLLFVGSLGVIYLRKQKEQARITTSNFIYSIEEKRNMAEARIIIGDNEKAKEFLFQAEELLAQLSPDQKEFKEEIAELKTGIEEQRKKVYHLAEITEPNLVYNFVNLGPEVQVDNIIVLRKKLYAFKKGQNLVWEYSLDDKKTRELQLSELAEGNLNYALKKNDDEIYFYLDNDKLSEYSTVSEKIKMIDFSVIQKANLRDLYQYSDNLYFLDTANNQIWRYVAVDNGFSSPKGWFQESVSLEKADSLAVDGEIYILETDGQIKKFFRGQSREFVQEKVEPEISEAKQLYTTQDSDYLYYLAPEKLIVLDKTGKVKIQYTSPKFTNLKDFVINEAEKKIYVLTENSVYSFAAEHL